MKRYAVSIKNKNIIPKNDGQQKLVYQFDSRLEKLIEEKSIFVNEEYLSLSKKIFEDEGFIDMNVFANKSEKVSQVNIQAQKLSFSNISINTKCYETIIHELTHGICRFHYGYNYNDSHNELFVNILIDMVKKHCNIKENDILKQADISKVKYFIDINLKKKYLNKNDFEKIKSEYENHNKIYESISLKKSFESVSFLKNENVLVTFFKNKEDFFIYTERNLLSFEKDLYVNPFKNKKELVNTIVVSPLFKVHKDGSINKKGLYHSFGFCDINKARNNDYRTTIYQLKESAFVEREKLLENRKEIGFKILKPKTIEQFMSIQSFFFESI